jgi:RNA-splicing ligase RtcB
MIEIRGKYNAAKVFADHVEESATSQVIELCNQSFVKGSQIRMMPDLHSGAGCVIGTTMTITDKVVPSFVGVDLGCGVEVVKLGDITIDFTKLDKFITNKIPHGHGINKEPVINFKDAINSLICLRDLHKDVSEFNRAIGSLGGGNHFIEVDKDENDDLYLVIHSGSRNMGLQIAKHYQDRAFDYHNGINDDFEKAKLQLIEEYKTAGKRAQIQNALDVLKKQFRKESAVDKDFCYVEGLHLNDYLHDMGIAQRYAALNREVMAKRIVEECLDLKIDDLESFTTIHNYIDLDNLILRKGAVSAQQGEILIIPINMRDGSLICKGKGNPDWNFSAPHGAGRLMSRTVAKENLSMEEFKNSMSHIYTTSVRQSTLDEAPLAYKPMQEIIDNIGDTVDILKIIKPLYNFKSGG